MTRAERERIKELVDVLSQQTPEAREALLAQEPEAIRACVQRLVEANGEIGDFLSGPAVDAVTLPPAEALLGATIHARYHLASLLGEGGFGVVYLAQDLNLKCPVALKVLHGGVLSQSAFENERDALKNLRHPGVIGVKDAGQLDDGRFFVVTDYVNGVTLGKRLADGGPLPASETRLLGIKLAQALAEAHRKKIVHLDLKPGNVMLDGEQPVILDFGVAALGDRTLFSKPGGAKPSALEDVRALAQLLYLARHGVAYPQASPQKPETIWRTLCDSTQIEPPAISSAEEIERAVKAGFRRAGWLKNAAIGLPALGVPLALLAVLSARQPSYHYELPEPLTSLVGRERCPTITPDGRKVVFSWRKVDGQAQIEELDLATRAMVALTDGPDEDPCISPDGKLLAYRRIIPGGVDRLQVRPYGSAHAGRVLFAAQFGSCSWTADSREVIIAVAGTGETSRKILRVDAATGAPHTILETPAGSWKDMSPALSPDGKRLAFFRQQTRGSAQMQVAELDSGLNVRGAALPWGPEFSTIQCPSWSPDGRTLFFLGGPVSNRTLWRIGEGSAAPVQVLEAGASLEFVAVDRRTGDVIITRDKDDRNIWRVDLAAPGGAVTAKRTLVESTGNDEEPQVSPDGQEVAFISDRTGREQLWLASISGGNERMLSSFSEAMNLRPFWSRGSPGVWVVGTIDRKPATVLMPLDGGKAGRSVPARAAGVTRDGAGLYIVADQGRQMPLSIYDIAGGVEHVVVDGQIRAVEESIGREFLYVVDKGELFRLRRSNPDQRELLVLEIRNRNFAVGRSGIYYLTGPKQPELRYFDLQTRVTRSLLALEHRPGYGLGITPDERVVIFTQLDREGSDLELLRRVR